MKVSFGKLGLALGVVLTGAAFFGFGLNEYLTLDTLKARQTELKLAFDASPIEFSLSFALLYIAATAMSVPGATVMTLAAGFLFGFWRGLGLVSLSSTIGATLAFLASRFLLSSIVERKFSERVTKINSGVQKEGAFYLLSLRLVPVFPFFLVNLAMGLTKIRTLTFAYVSLVGMLPGTAAYINAGTQLSEVTSLKSVLSPTVLVSFILIGVLPLFAKKLIDYFKRKAMNRKFKKPKAYDYNLLVIGAGSGGLVSAYIASAVKAKVALIEKHKMGGDCLNTGCVPSKALIRSAKIASHVRRANDFGIQVEKTSINFAAVMERVSNVINKIEPHDSVERYQNLGVECIHGEAKILSPFEVEVGAKVLTTRNIVIATGARPAVPSIPGLDEVDFLTSDTVWKLRDLPKRLLILGGGPIGCELAQAFQRLGSQVTIVELSARIMAREDEDVSQFVTGVFQREGINLLTSHKATRFGSDANGKYLVCDINGRESRVEFDQVLLALGRKANTQGFGLQELGVKLTERGTIDVNAYMQTNYPNIYACGDVAGPFQFTHTAAHQAWYAAVNALFSPFKKFAADYTVIPWCTFVDPEVARVGLNESEAKERSLEFETTKYYIDDLDRAIADSEDHGFVKVLTGKNSDHILGVTIVGDHASDTIAEFVAAMKNKIGLKKILGTIHIYPTFAEANKYAAGLWQQNHKPERALKFLKWFHSKRRG